MIIGAAAFLGVVFVSIFRGDPEGIGNPNNVLSYEKNSDLFHVDDGTLFGEAKAAKLENATLKFVLPIVQWSYADPFLAEQN